MSDTRSREEILDEALDFVQRSAAVALRDADQGAFQKSDTLKQIAEKIRVALAEAEKAK